MTEDLDRVLQTRAGRRVEYLSITWTSLEAIIGATVGILAGSVALIGKARLIAIVRPIDWSAPAFLRLPPTSRLTPQRTC